MELGLPLEANEEVESIKPEMKTFSEMLAVRVAIFRALEEWDLLHAVARQLCHQQPDEPEHFLSLASATRRAVGLQEALTVLATVANRFPTCAALLYNLACYAAAAWTSRLRPSEVGGSDQAGRRLPRDGAGGRRPCAVAPGVPCRAGPLLKGC